MDFSALANGLIHHAYKAKPHIKVWTPVEIPSWKRVGKHSNSIRRGHGSLVSLPVALQTLPYASLSFDCS